MDLTDISALSSPIVTVSPSPFLLASLVRAPISSGLAPARGKDGKNKLSCVENLVGIYSNHMVFRQNLSPLFREPSLFFRGDEFYKNLFRELSRRTVPFEEEIFTI